MVEAGNAELGICEEPFAVRTVRIRWPMRVTTVYAGAPARRPIRDGEARPRGPHVHVFWNLFQRSRLTPREVVVTLLMAWQWTAKGRTDVPEVSPTPGGTASSCGTRGHRSFDV